MGVVCQIIYSTLFIIRRSCFDIKVNTRGFFDWSGSVDKLGTFLRMFYFKHAYNNMYRFMQCFGTKRVAHLLVIQSILLVSYCIRVFMVLKSYSVQ